MVRQACSNSAKHTNIGKHAAANNQWKLLRETHCRVLQGTQRKRQLWTLNQRVGGSSPPRLTIIFSELRQVERPAVFRCGKTCDVGRDNASSPPKHGPSNSSILTTSTPASASERVPPPYAITFRLVTAAPRKLKERNRSDYVRCFREIQSAAIKRLALL